MGLVINVASFPALLKFVWQCWGKHYSVRVVDPFNSFFAAENKILFSR
jgi:hypothetical protein